jgi:hypothetical protein
VTIDLTEYEKAYILLALATYAEHHWEPDAEEFLPLTSEEITSLIKKLIEGYEKLLTPS